MAKPLAIHILPDSNPTNILGMIKTLVTDESLRFESSKELVDYLRDAGYSANDWVTSTSTSMGLLERREDGIKLVQDGKTLTQVRDDARADLLHFLMYAGWSVDQPTAFLQSWAYRQVCDQYWSMGEVSLSSDFLNNQVSEIINLAQVTFSEIDVGEFDEISFSRKSIRGALNWLEAVNPPVIEGETFKRRSFCPPELVLMAIGYVLRDEEDVIGIDILLTPEKREQISKICLLEPDALDRALDWSMPIFSNLIMPGTTAGFYGRFVRLHRRPTVGDMVR